MGKLGAEYAIVVTDERGDVVGSESGESDSFVKNFMRLIEAGMWNVGMSVVDLSGTTRQCGNFTCTTKADVSGVTTRHILVGLGTDPVSADDYALAEQIPNSILMYQPSLVPPEPPYVDGGFIKSRIATRAFVNRTSGPVEIREIGIAVLASGYNVLILRDVFPEPVNVPPGGAVVVSYTFKSPADGGFTLNYMRALVCSFDGSAVAPVVDVGGIARSISFGGVFPTNALAEQSTYGLVVGTSGVAPTGDENSVLSPVLHGKATGQLQYGAMGRKSTVVSGNVIEFSLTRSLINVTQEPITIREIGLVARHSGYDILLERNVFDPIEIPPYDGVNVTITHQTVI